MNAAPTVVRLFLAVALLALLTGGCLAPSFEQQSDWKWQQYNPNYRPPYPVDRGWNAP
jgi:hypothetical protein